MRDHPTTKQRERATATTSAAKEEVLQGCLSFLNPLNVRFAGRDFSIRPRFWTLDPILPSALNWIPGLGSGSRSHLGIGEADIADDHGVDDVAFLPALGVEGVFFVEDFAEVGEADVEGGRDLW